jgi:DNA-binding response OmpR family regulator
MAERVLLSIEDDDAEYFIITIALKELDIPIRFIRVPDGEQGIWFLANTHGHELAPRPDLILLNLNLPKKNGFEVLTEIRGNELLRSIPVIIFTTSSSTAERKRALSLGATDFISKPGTITGLIETLRTVCTQFLA